MPTAKCKKCGGLTNSTTSDYWLVKDHEPTECYAKFVDGRWVKGCTKPPLYKKAWIDSLIKPEESQRTMIVAYFYPQNRTNRLLQYLFIELVVLMAIL